MFFARAYKNEQRWTVQPFFLRGRAKVKICGTGTGHGGAGQGWCFTGSFEAGQPVFPETKLYFISPRMAVFSAMLVGTVCGVAVLGTTLISLARFHLHHHIMAALKNIIMTIAIISLSWLHQHHHNPRRQVSPPHHD